MPRIVGGLDIHRKQITFDYLDTETGEVSRGQISPADGARLRAWFRARFEHPEEVELAVEACTGWRYVAEEARRAGITILLAEPADTAVQRGPKRRAKTDSADARLMRTLVAEHRLPQCWIPPAHILDCRAMLQAYHDLRTSHTAWVQRIHAVFFHHGAPVLGGLAAPGAPARLTALAAGHLSRAGQMQVAAYLAMMAATEEQMDILRRQLVAAARHVRGARELQRRLYGVGPISALALVCWLGGEGRFSSSRKAVRFTGLDITVRSSDGKRTRGRLSRQGPPVLRWALYEAAKTYARASAPDHAYYAAVKDRIDGKRAALSVARKLTRQAMHILAKLGDDALTVD